MAGKTPSAELSRLTDGINRFDRQAGPNQTVDACNVIEDDGYCRRRDAFTSVATGAPFVLPAGKTFLYTGTELSPTTYYDRVLSASASAIGGAAAIKVACLEKFAAIDWRHVTDWPGKDGGEAVTHHSRLWARYWNGTSWTDIPSVVDSTIRVVKDSGDDYWAMTLCKDGMISWHLSQISDWTAQTVSTQSVYVIELRIINYVDGAADTNDGTLAANGTLTLEAPGPRAAILEPVRSIFPVNAGGRSLTIISTDRQSKRGLELGAQLGSLENRFVGTKVEHVVEDEGGGIQGQITIPNTQRATPPQPWPDGTWTDVGGSVTLGTADELTKNQTDTSARNYYEWATDQFRGGKYIADIAPTTASNDGTRLYTTINFTADTLQHAILQAGDWEHFRLRCTTKGAGGTPVDEEREVVGVTYVSGTDPNEVWQIRVHEHFSVQPDTDNRFDLYRPHCRLRFRDGAREYEVQDTTNPDTLATTTGRAFEADITGGSAPDNDSIHHFQLGRPLEWVMESATFWSQSYEPSTREVLLTNGNGILSHNGVSLRRLTAMSDPDNVRVQSWVGSVPDTANEALQDHSLAGAKLRSRPPAGRFIATFAGRIVVAGGHQNPYEINWSAVANDSDIWPRGYTTAVGGDDEGDAISGMRVVGSYLCVFTPTAIYTSGPPGDDGYFTFQVVSQGIGFPAHRAMASISSRGGVVVGPTADGVSLWDGITLTQVLDKWERVLPRGVNSKRLHLAAGAFSLERNEYYLAVPSSGSDVLDKILVFNLETGKWWLWDAPWGGVGDIAVMRKRNGTEELLFGTEDGHIAVLRGSKTDDGDAITGYAKTPIVQPFGMKTFGPAHVALQMLDAGEAETVTLKTFANGTKQASSQARKFHADGGEFGTDSWDDRNDAALAALTQTQRNAIPRMSEERWVRRQFALPQKRAESVQVEVRGTGRWKLRGVELIVGGTASHRSK